MFPRGRVLPQPKWAVFFPLDEAWDSIDMQDTLHPQTLIAYGMNGKDLSPDHGALRAKVRRQLGYKSVKFLWRIVFRGTLKNSGKGLVQPDFG